MCETGNATWTRGELPSFRGDLAADPYRSKTTTDVGLSK